MNTGSSRTGYLLSKAFELGVAAILLTVILFPVIWLVLISVRSVAEVYQYPLTFFPKELVFDAYREVWLSKGYSTDWLRYFLNTAVIACFAATGVMLLGLLLGYVLSRMRGPWVGRVQLLFIVIQLFEGPALIIPVYLALSWLGLYNSAIGYILLLIVFFLPFAALLSLSFAYSVPIEIDEAARIDGCSDWQFFRKVFIPSAKVGMVTVGLMAFLLVWGEYPFALTLLQGENRTVSTALVDLISGLSVYWNNLAAAATIISLPVILVLVFAQKHIVSGLTSGSVK
ncbi:carbohydrate ABC transporter permease [Chelativorans sp. AA-79]|uniref:carbohydrate ABC transporter permease n=1 Tax=Chelativorans sp. AA-79 TaxID=3028735 RepID=UPI0023F76E17|nr:carbohydrate ABC transporter permease [Chelativorans sp. AA-79]WEX12246.1 carbohydrate ABC transporter permease [Chelativorans sp. AA-79]